MLTTASSTTALIDRPLRLNEAVTAPNRLALAPMTNCLSTDTGEVSEAEIAWYRSRADAGFGTIVTGGLSVSPEGQIRRNQPRVDDDRYVPGLARLAASRRPGTVMLAQLLHGGLRVDHAWSGHTLEAVGPSDGCGVRGLTEAGIEIMLDRYVDAAKRTIEAGFDGVDIHAAHGYLPAQFLSQLENTRDDAWGGDFAGRTRFTLELVSRFREALPSSAVIQLRISAEDFRQSRGIDLDESAELTVLGAEAGADIISLSVWDIHQPSQKHPHTSPVEHVRARLSDRVPLAIAGKMWDSRDAALGFALGGDQLVIGRAAIFNRTAPRVLRTPGLTPKLPPVAAATLADEGVDAPFLEYLTDKWHALFTPAA